MLRTLALSRTTQLTAQRAVLQRVLIQGLSTGAQTQDVNKFIADVLASKKFSKADIESELAKFQKANVKTMDLLRKLNMHDYEQATISVGAARAIQDALWELKHEEQLKTTETKLKLRRENSSKLESRQKRL